VSETGCGAAVAAAALEAVGAEGAAALHADSTSANVATSAVVTERTRDGLIIASSRRRQLLHSTVAGAPSQCHHAMAPLGAALLQEPERLRPPASVMCPSPVATFEATSGDVPVAGCEGAVGWPDQVPNGFATR